jgi:hypothetical protein
MTRGEVTAKQQNIKQAENVFIRDRLRIKLHSIAEFINFDIKYQNNYLKFLNCADFFRSKFYSQT